MEQPATWESDMGPYVHAGGLKVHRSLHDLVRDEIAPGTGVEPEAFWTGLGAIVRDLGPENARLLAQRDALQAKIDEWNRRRGGQPVSADESRAFLREIGYLAPESGPFQITTERV